MIARTRGKDWFHILLAVLVVFWAFSPQASHAQDDFGGDEFGSGSGSGDAGGGDAAGSGGDASAGGDAPAGGDAAGGESPDAPPAEDGAVAANLSESDQVENILEKFPFKLDKDKDPFKPLVVKKVAKLPTVAPKAPVKIERSDGPPPPPPPPPLKMTITGICGNDSERLAMVMFENQLKVVKKDDEVKGKFKVVDILNDKIVVYSTKEQMRRTFPIGGGKE